MSKKKINATLIGLFIVIGLGLLITGVIVFSSFRLFSQSAEVIVYFDQTLNGLSEGAPVKYRGVTIGAVKRVMVRYNQARDDYAMPVILEIEEHLLKERLGEPMNVFNRGDVEKRVKAGLRASLQTESLVTGVLYVDLRPNPEAPPPHYHQLAKEYPEIPSEPTQIQQMFDNLATFDLNALQTNLNALLIKLDAAVGHLNMAHINQGVTNLLTAVERLAVAPELTNALAGVRPTLEQYRLLADKLSNRVDPLADQLTNSLAEANRTLAQVRGTAENLRSVLAPNSPLRNDLSQALEELASAAQSVAALVEFLNRHPNALITGRELPKKKNE